MKLLKIVALVVVILAVVLLIAAPSIAETIAFNRFEPQQRADMEARYKVWKATPITLPEVALDAQPYSPELLAAARAYHDAWLKHCDLVNNKKELTGTKEELAALAPLTDAFTTLARRPDFKLGAIIADTTTGQVDSSEAVPRLLACQSGAKVLRLKVQAEARAGQLDEAMQDAETILLASRSDGCESLVNELISVALCSIGVSAWADVVRPCQDPALLRRMLEKQQALAGQLVFFNQHDLPLASLDVVGMLREYKRVGVRVDYQNLKGREMVRCYGIINKKMSVPAQIKALQEAKTRGPQNVAYAKQVQTAIDELKKHPVVAPAEITIAKESWLERYKNSLIEPFTYGLAEPNFLEAFARADVALNKFDLLRLETARKLYTLEKGKAPASDADLVPAYLAKLPVDRFTAGKKGAFKEASGVCYSIGPDGKDNGNAINYDPSNGTVSAGDVALLKR